MYKILVVDDEPEIVKILASFLAKNSFEVEKARDGAEAIRILNSGVKLDLIFLDMKMPKVTGLDVLKELARLSLKIPVIILTGSVDVEQYMEDLKKLGYGKQDVLYKPVNLFELLKAAKDKLRL